MDNIRMSSYRQICIDRCCGGSDLIEFSDDSPKGCILEFDPEYPKELHDLHNDYHLAPQKTEIKRVIFSDYYKKIMGVNNI